MCTWRDSQAPCGKHRCEILGADRAVEVEILGGAFVLVPALVLGTWVPIKLAVGTSLVVIAVNAAVACASNAGSLVGARLSTKLPPAVSRKAFAGVLVLVAAAVLAKTLWR